MATQSKVDRLSRLVTGSFLIVLMIAMGGPLLFVYFITAGLILPCVVRFIYRHFKSPEFVHWPSCLWDICLLEDMQMQAGRSSVAAQRVVTRRIESIVYRLKHEHGIEDRNVAMRLTSFYDFPTTELVTEARELAYQSYKRASVKV